MDQSSYKYQTPPESQSEYQGQYHTSAVDPQEDGQKASEQASRARRRHGCLCFWSGFFLMLTVATAALTTFLGVTMVVPYSRQSEWVSATNADVVSAVVSTSNKITCRCDPHGSDGCASRYACLTVKVTPSGSTKQLTLYLTNDDVEHDNECFFNPKDTCHRYEDVNLAVMERYAASLQSSRVHMYYTSRDEPSKAILGFTSTEQGTILLHVLPAGCACIASLIIFAILSICSLRS